MPTLVFSKLQKAAEEIGEGALPEAFERAAALVGKEVALGMFIAFEYKKLEGHDGVEEFSRALKYDLKRCTSPGYADAIIAGCELFYMNRSYALDNFSSFVVVYKGMRCPTAEHAYQLSKFLPKNGRPSVEQLKLIYQVLHAPSTHEAKAVTKTEDAKVHIRPDWKEAKELVMEEILNLKFDQHAYVQKSLERTKGLIIIEDSSQDSFWGRGPDWKGKNRLGRIWMKIRMERFGF